VINRVKTFTEEDCNKIETTVDNLDKLWINRSCTRRFSYENQMHISRAPFWTLGAVSYLDHVKSSDQYDKHRDYLNPVLLKKFNWIYESSAKDCKENLANLSSLMGFLLILVFIFFCKSGTTIEPEYIKMFEQPLGSVHVDVQWEEHHDYWNTFDKVNLEDTLSFTVPIKLPSGGGGLYTWADEVNPYSFNYTTNENKLAELESPAIPNLYTEGEMIYFIGHLLHQMMPGVNVQPTDRRITVQGHGQKCDGVWRLYW